MIEKSGVLVLTEQDIEEYEKGIVSERLKSAWGLDYNQLQDLIRNGQCEVVKVNQNSTICRYKG